MWVGLSLSVLLAHAAGMQPSAGSTALQPTQLLRTPCDITAAALAPANETAHAIRTRLISLGAPPPRLDATHADLLGLLASALRVQAVIADGERLDNRSALADAIAARGEPLGSTEGAPALEERLAHRLHQECFLLDRTRPLVASLALEDLQSGCAERLISSSGSRTELIQRLFTFQQNCDEMVSRDAGFACTAAHIKEVLSYRSLSNVGSKEELLARLVESVRVSGWRSAMLAQCDLTTHGPICLADGAKMLAADAAPPGLLARYTFDDSLGLDSAGKANHADTSVFPLRFGPGVGGHGHAARFDGSSYLQVPNHPSYTDAGSTFTVELWVYLRQDSTGDWRTLLHKGSRDDERTPAIFLEPLTRGIEFFVSTTDPKQKKGERLWSNSFLPLHRWTHLAAVAEGHSIRLYVNGLLDAENVTTGTIVQNVGPLRVGGDPWRPAGGMTGFVDELRLHSRALSTDEIQASASFALGGVEPSFVELGCMGCPMESARASCRSGYHLCNQRDMYSGGYMVARSMGWATSTSHVWTAEEVAAGGALNASWGGTPPGTVLSGLGLCCAESD